MAGMGYPTTLAVLSHALHAYTERCMKTEDVVQQMMRNDLDRVMKEWLCTSKEEMTREAEDRSWDDTIDNVCHRITMCDHLLEFRTWRNDDPKPFRGISFATATRHLRTLRKHLEKLMGKSARGDDPPWTDLPKRQWEVLWEGETTWKKYGALLWEAGYKTVTLFPGASETPIHSILCMAGDGIQTQYAQVPNVKRMPAVARKTIQAYLNLVDWRHIQEGGPQGDVKDWSTSSEFTQWREQREANAIPSQEVGERICDLIHEPFSPILMEGLEEVKGLLKKGTPTSYGSGGFWHAGDHGSDVTDL